MFYGVEYDSSSLQVTADSPNQIKNVVIFVADQDMWFFTGIPEKYRDTIIFTRGYSLENDLYLKQFY